MANRFLSNIKINDAYTFPASDGTNGQVIVTDGAGNLSFQDSSGTSVTSIFKDVFTGDGSTVNYTLSGSVDNELKTQVYFSGVYQSKDNYTVSGNVISFTSAPPVGMEIEVITFSSVSTFNVTNQQNGDLLVWNSTTQTWDNTKVIQSVQFDGGTGTQGTMSWNAEDETVDLIVSPDVTYQLGQELGLVVRNISGQTINNGNVVKVIGASGNKVTIDLASNTGEYDSSSTFAVVTETIANNSTGRVTMEGLVRGLDTSTFTEGVAIWLGASGQFTSTKPLSPNHLVHVGWVVRSHATEGIIFVKISNGWELEELHDVLIANVADKDLLSWNAISGVWENTKTLGDITTGNITTSGTVDGVDVSLFKSDYDTHNHDNIYYTELEVDGFLANKNNWDTAYSWGNHAAAGYLTSFTETDPTVPYHVKIISISDVANWNLAYGWGNHAGLYLGVGAKAADSELLDGVDGSGYLRVSPNSSTPYNGNFAIGNNGSTNFIQSHSGQTLEINPLGNAVTINGSAAIHAGNIGSQSVNYASSAGTANNALALSGYGLDGATSVATRIFNNKGQVHATYTDFNTAMTPGPNYLQGGTNGPTGTASQWYGFMLGLGSEYNTETGNANGYGSQLYWSRQSQGGFPYLYARDLEAGTWGSWRKMSAGYADTAGSANSVAWSNISSIPSLWYQSGSWLADFASYSFVRENGVTMSGGSEFVLLSRSGQGHVLIDGSYWAGEQGGFYSLNTSNQYTSQVGFSRDSNAFAAFNTTVSAANDMRAPIFYDSNNTGYYLDPASNSQLNTVSIGAGAKLHLVSIGDGNHFLRYVSSGFSGVTIDGPQLAGHQGGELATNYGGDNYSLRWDYGGNTFSRGSSRAPIFYDSNDTGYYVDPTNNSSIYQAISFGDSSRYSAVSTTINGSGAGDKLILYGNTSNYDARVLVGADYDFIFKSQGSPANKGMFRFYSGNNATLAMEIGADQVVTAPNSSMRAPIFYDSNNTSYYTDPADQSRILALKIGNQSTFNSGSTYALQLSHDNRYLLALNAGNSSWYPWLVNDAWLGERSLIFHFNGVADRFWFTSGGHMEAATSVRSPIFYDSGNTSYYINADSTSNLYNLELGGAKHTYLYITPGAGYEAMVRYNGGSGGTWYAGKRTSTQLLGSTNAFHFYSDSAAATVGGYDTGGNHYASGSSRAPIFYDNDNTSYYVNPDATSRLYNMEVNFHSFPYREWDFTWGSHGANNSMPSMSFAMWDNYTQSGAPSSYGTLLDFYGLSGHQHDQLYFAQGSIKHRYGWYGNNNWNGWYEVYTSNNGSMQTPILYDSNNTGYYVDANATSNIGNLHLDGYIHVSRSNTTGNGIILADDGDIVDLNDAYCSMRFTYGVRVFSANRGGSAVHTLHSNGTFTASGDVVAYSDARVKENIEPITNALEKTLSLKGVYYNRTDKEDKSRKVGVIAQEIIEVLPEVVTEDDQGMLGVSYGNITAVLIEAIKELSKKVEELENKLNGNN